MFIIKLKCGLYLFLAAGASNYITTKDLGILADHISHRPRCCRHKYLIPFLRLANIVKPNISRKSTKSCIQMIRIIFPMNFQYTLQDFSIILCKFGNQYIEIITGSLMFIWMVRIRSYLEHLHGMTKGMPLNQSFSGSIHLLQQYTLPTQQAPQPNLPC